MVTVRHCQIGADFCRSSKMFHSLLLTHQCAKYPSRLLVIFCSEVRYGSIGRRFACWGKFHGSFAKQWACLSIFILFLRKVSSECRHTGWNIMNHIAFRMKTININIVPHARWLIVLVPLCKTHNRGTVGYFTNELS